MALGTNYARNESKETKAIDGRIRLAKQYAKEFEADLGMGPAIALGLASEVVMGRKTIKQVYEEYTQQCHSTTKKTTSNVRE